MGWLSMLANHKLASNTRFGAFGPKESWFKQGLDSGM